MKPRFLLAASAAAVLAALGCADRVTVPDATPPPASATLRVDCRVDVRARTLSCGGATAARGNVIVGGQGTYVRLASSGTAYDADSAILRTSVTVKNLMAQAMGTTTGADTAGFQVFFASGPTVTAGSGTVTVANADGQATFTSAGQPFFTYREIVEPNYTSLPRVWKFALPATVTTFVFSVYVSTPFPAEHGVLRWTREQGAMTGHLFYGMSGGGGSLYAVGTGSVIMRRDRDGWGRMYVPGTRTLFAVWAAPDGQAIATGVLTSLLYDGRSWRSISTPSQPIVALAGTSINDVWGIQPHGLAHWNGAFWSNEMSGSPATYRSIAIDPAAGGVLAAGVRGQADSAGACRCVFARVLSLHHATLTETDADSAWDLALTGVAAAADGSALAVGWVRADSLSPAVGLVLARDSVEGAWTRRAGAGSGFRAVVAAPDGSYYLLADSALYRMDGGGLSLVPNSAHTAIERLYVEGDTVYGLSAYDVLRLEPGGWVSLIPQADGSDLLGVWAADETNVWASGRRRILRRGESGWAVEAAGTPWWFGVGGASARDVYAVGSTVDTLNAAVPDTAYVAHFDGTAWSAQRLPMLVDGWDERLYAVWAADSAHVFLAGYRAPVDGSAGEGMMGVKAGSGWNLTFAGGTGGVRLYAIHGTGPGDVWAVGAQGPAGPTQHALAMHHDGTAWTPTLIADSVLLQGVWAVSPTDVYATGYVAPTIVGVIYHYDGVAWTRVYRGGGYLGSVWATGANDVYVTGSGTALHFNGSAWSRVEPGTTHVLRAVYGTSPRNLYSVGYGGVIVHGQR
ncbi:MAG TPA: hypothetical protein VFJ82_16855 [Longimicrobium sp.]|nr:hypothetical protein [Longimicrobium sp.]